VAACHWLINNGYLDVINGQGFYEISKKGNNVKTANDFSSQLNHSKQSPRADSLRLNQETTGKPVTLYRFPKIELSDSELMWLQIISKGFLGGYLADVNQLKKSLHAQGKWPQNFRPSEIDYRLFQRENIPTLLGIWHADPESSWIAKFDELIKYIQVKLPTTKEIKVTDIAESIGISEANTSLLIHLLPSVGLSYAAVGKPLPRNATVLPGQVGTYATLQLDDPEKMDGYLAYKNLEEQVKNFYGDQTGENQSDANEELTLANQLYDKAQSLIQNLSALDENTARIVVESADDAIKEFGSTNQEKKVQLREWKAKAELVLPPGTIQELRKRAERELLKKSYPKSTRMRNVVLAVVGVAVILLGLWSLMKALGIPRGLWHHPSAAPKAPELMLELTNSGKEPVVLQSRGDLILWLPQSVSGGVRSIPGKYEFLPASNDNRLALDSITIPASSSVRASVRFLSETQLVPILDDGSTDLELILRRESGGIIFTGQIPFTKDALQSRRWRVDVSINKSDGPEKGSSPTPP
jgi:hypothetical protein